MTEELDTLTFPDADAWEDWLVRSHATSAGVWLRIAKKGAEETTLTYSDALDVALCHGWIDGQKRSLSSTHWLQRFTRRTPRSPWSQVNKERVALLVDQDRMRPAGLAQVDAAKKDGRWEAAYAGQRTMEVPDDLADAMGADPQAAAFFAGLTRSERYSILWRVHDAKRPATRKARIEKYVQLCKDQTRPR